MDLPSSGAQWMGNLQRNLCRSSSAGPALPRFLHCLVSCPSPNFPLALPNCSMQTSSKGRSLMKTHLHPPYPPFIFCSPFCPCSWTCLRLSHCSAVVVALRPPLVASAECGRGSLGGDPRAAAVMGGGGTSPWDQFVLTLPSHPGVMPASGSAQSPTGCQGGCHHLPCGNALIILSLEDYPELLFARAISPSPLLLCFP